MSIILKPVSIINTESTDLIQSFIPNNEHFIEKFLNKKIKNINTRKAYNSNIKEFFNVANVADISLDDIRCVTIFDVEDWINSMMRSGYASSTISRKISSISSLYKWLLKYQDNSTGIKIIQFNPFAAMSDEKPRVNNRITQFLTQEELKFILRRIDTSSLSGFRNKLIISLVSTTALRKSEFLNIKIKDIDEYNGFKILKILGKGDKLAIVKLQPVIKNMIDIYLNKTNRDYNNNSEEYLFISHSSNSLGDNTKPLDESTLNKALKKLCSECKIKKNITVHSLRHSAITLSIQSGYSIEKVRDFARHSNISTTNRYVHSINSLKDNPSDKLIEFIS